MVKFLQHNKKFCPFFLLYLAEGAPIGLIWWTIPTLLRDKGIGLVEISYFTGLMALPWAFKFFVAPILDNLCSGPKRLKAWIVFAQLLMSLTLILSIPFFVGEINLAGFQAVLLIHAFFAATQDVGIDSLAIKSIPEGELGKANAWMQAGLLIGNSLIGGPGIWLAKNYHGSWVFYIVVFIVAISSLSVFSIRTRENAFIKTDFKSYLLGLKKFFSTPLSWLGILLALFMCFSFKGISLIAGPLLREKNISANMVSVFYSFAVPIALLVGSIWGGKISDSSKKTEGIKKAHFMMGLTLMLLIFVLWGKFHEGLFVALTLNHIGVGIVTVTLYAFLMKLTNEEYAAFQFSLFMAMVNLSESLSGYLVGYMKTYTEEGAIFATLFVLSCGSYFFMKRLNRLSFS